MLLHLPPIFGSRGGGAEKVTRRIRNTKDEDLLCLPTPNNGAWKVWEGDSSAASLSSRLSGRGWSNVPWQSNYANKRENEGFEQIDTLFHLSQLMYNTPNIFVQKSK